MNKTPFDLVIFDCDGVLVNTEPLVDQIYSQMLEEHGQTFNRTSLHEFSGMTIQDRLKVSSQQLGWTPPESFLPEFFARLAELSKKELKPVDGIYELVESLPVPVCVASNGTRDEIVLRLKIANLTDFFGAAIFSGLEVPRPKPAPDVFLAAAESFNAHPSRCIVVEDSVPGVTAAVSAGIKVYGHAAFTPAESLREAGAIPFANMAELKNILSMQVA
jgi:phosphoglycolate phosphatase